MALPANLATNDVIDEVWVDAVTTTLAAAAPTAWTAVTFQNGWVNFGGSQQVLQYRKEGDVVRLRGMAKSGTVGTIICVLPVGFRPPGQVQSANGPIAITTAGEIYHQGSTNGAVDIGTTFSVTA
jgi:hypothetical protein